jgi:hypothetical protein
MTPDRYRKMDDNEPQQWCQNYACYTCFYIVSMGRWHRMGCSQGPAELSGHVAL